MRVHWWHSIRWRFALVSILVALLATTLLAITIIVAVNYYYGVDLRQRLTNIAGDTAQRIGESYVAQKGRFVMAVHNVLPNKPDQSAQNQEYLLLVLNMGRTPLVVYPHYSVANPGPSFTKLLLAIADPSVRQVDFTKISTAVRNAR